MPFLHDIAVIAATILAVFWAFGVRWGWRYLANGVLRHPALRGPAALLFWWFFWGIARFISVQAALLAVGVAALAMHPGPVLADLVLKNKENGYELRLLDTPCSHGETLAVLNEEWRPKFKNARILTPKGFIESYGCWIKQGDETIVLILSDGGALAFKADSFTDPAI